MHHDIFAGKWNEMKGRVKQTWGELTDDEIVKAAGHLQQLAGLIQQHYGRTKEEVEREIDDFMRRYEQDTSQTKH